MLISSFTDSFDQMANVNNCDMLAKFSEEIREKHTPPDKSSDVQRFKIVTKMFHDLIGEL